MRRTIWLTLLLLLIAVQASAFNKKDRAYLGGLYTKVPNLWDGGLPPWLWNVANLDGTQ